MLEFIIIDGFEEEGESEKVSVYNCLLKKYVCV